MEASLQITKEKMEELTGNQVLQNEARAIDWRKQVSYLLYSLANDGFNSPEFKNALDHLQAKHDEWIFFH